MERNRPITEDDVYLTELLLKEHYGKLKQSVVRGASDSLGSFGKSLGGTVRDHPYAAAGAAIGAGVLLFGLVKLLGGGDFRRHDTGREERRGKGMHAEIFSLLMPIVTPYVMAYLEKFLGSMVSRDRR